MTTIILNKDLDLKLLCKLLFKIMGYTTHFEIMVRSKSYVSAYKTHDISDIDVLGYKFNLDLSYCTVGSECKSGESSALEELFKFLGIVEICDIDTGYLIKTKIHQNAREVAIKNNFRCFTEAELRKLLLGLGIEIDKQLRIENVKYQKKQKCLKKFKSQNEKLVDYTTLDYWNKENWKNIHNITHLLHSQNITGKLFTDSNATIDDKFIYYYLMELFSRAVLKLISEAMVLNYADIDGAIINCLYGGAESLNEKRRINDLMTQATRENYALEPAWHNDLVSILSRFSQSTGAASKIPNLFQDVYENAFYDNSLKFEPKVFSKYTDITRKFAQDLIQFIEKSCKLPSEIFADFMKL